MPLITNYIASLQQKRYAANTCFHYKTWISYFLKFLASTIEESDTTDKLLLSATSSTIADFILANKNNKVSTVRLKVLVLKQFYNYLVNLNLRTDNPVLKQFLVELKGVNDPTYNRIEPNVLSKVEFLANSDRYHDKLDLILFTFASLGLKSNEIELLNEEDLNLENLSISVRGPRPRVILLSTEDKRKIQDFLSKKREFFEVETFDPYAAVILTMNGKRMGPRSLRRRMRNVFGNSLRNFRANYILQQLTSGVDSKDIKRIVGVSSLERYEKFLALGR